MADDGGLSGPVRNFALLRFQRRVQIEITRICVSWYETWHGKQKNTKRGLELGAIPRLPHKKQLCCASLSLFCCRRPLGGSNATTGGAGAAAAASAAELRTSGDFLTMCHVESGHPLASPVGLTTVLFASHLRPWEAPAEVSPDIAGNPRHFGGEYIRHARPSLHKAASFRRPIY